jgi:hypothetical protein
MWRSGSSFVWTRFRETLGTCCYYEPLHHGLARLTRQRLHRDTPESMQDRHHPVLERSYFAEFEPLLLRRGVRGYDAAFAYDRMVLDPEEPHPALKAYVASLIDRAAAQGLTAVLGFNRTNFRIGWLRRRFAARHIYVDRDPEAIWSSYLEQNRSGGSWYLATWLAVLERNREAPLLKPLAERMPLRSLTRRALLRRKDFYLRAAAAMGPTQSYFLVYYLWLASAAKALESCDLILDMGRMDDAPYRRSARDQLQALCGMSISLLGAHAAPSMLALDRRARQAIEADVLRIFPGGEALQASDLAMRLGEAPPRMAEHLSRIPGVPCPPEPQASLGGSRRSS